MEKSQKNPKLRITLRDESGNVILDSTVENAIIASMNQNNKSTIMMWAVSPQQLIELHMQTGMEISANVLGLRPTREDHKKEMVFKKGGD